VLEVSSDDASAVGVVAADEEEDDIATYRRRRRAVCFTWARSSTNRSKEGKRASEQFEKEARVFVARGKVKLTCAASTPFYTQDATLRETRNPTVRRQSTVISKTPAEPLRARAASPPSCDAFDTR
jgi:hypothetical protein